MATRAVSTTVTYRAWDTSANAPKTGDSGNHTLKWIKDGTSSSVTNAPAEVDSTNAKGVYKLVLTSTETDCTFGSLAGVSSTANIQIFGVQAGFDYVPTAATTFGAFIGNATAAIAADASGRVDVSKIAGTSQTARDIGASVLLAAGQKVDVDTIKTNPVVNAGTVTFPTGATLASTTNITAGTIATVTNLTNAPTAGDLTATMKTSVTTAATAATPVAASVTGAVGSVTGLTASDVGAIKTQTDKFVFTVANKIDANVLNINGDATAAANLSKTTKVIGRGTVDSGASTTSIPTTAFAPAGAAADQFKGRIITFDANTATPALCGQSTDITASSNAAAPTFTVTALTTAPSAGDTFSVT